MYPSAGPYRITEYRKGDRIEIRRNRFYGGQRRVHVDGFDVNLRGGDPVELLRSIERGDADWAWMLAGVFMSPGLDFEKYGLNKSRFWMLPGHALRILSFNTSRPLFRNNLRLRQAVNFALDRRALVASSYGPLATPPTDQHLLRHPGSGTRTSTRSTATSTARESSRAATCEAARPSSACTRSGR